MLRYFLKRLLVGVPTFFVASVLVFAAVSSEAGDPRERLLTCVDCDQSAYNQQVETYRLDEALPVQYGAWVGRLANGNLEPSTSQGEKPVLSVAAERLGNTLWLVGPAWIFATGLVIYLAASPVRNPGSVMAKVYRLLGTWGLAVPTFLTGLLLQTLVVLVSARWGIKPFWSQGLHNDSARDFLASATLPSLTLILMLVARRYSLTRSALEVAWNAPSIASARARGLSERRLLWRHTLRLSVGPFLAASWADVTLLVGGAVVVETVFAWPGIGRLLVTSLAAGDLELSLFLSLGAVGVVLLAGIAIDVLHAAVDPRVREQQ